MDKSAQDERRNRVVAQAFRCRRALEVYPFIVVEKFADSEEGTSMMAWTRAIVRLKVLQSLEKRNRRAKPITINLLTLFLS